VSPRKIDLHAHTTCSDGSDSPTELVGHALRAGIDVLALTDHDTLSGREEAREAATGTGMTVISGIELSAQVIDDYPGAIPRSVHVLGYLVDPENAELRAETERIRSHRADRLRLMVDKISKDFDITWAEVAQGMREGATPGRPHIAQVLIDKGYFLDTSAAFAGPLRPDGPYHVPHYAPRLHRALEIITNAGGVAVIAHPYTDERSGAVVHTQSLEKVIADYGVLVAQGLAGLEIDHRENSEHGKEVLAQVAREFDLIVTGSSDFHGLKKPNQLGENTTTEHNLERILAQASGAAPFS
jgi:predicted metal-dependent phosphoesterase TrpH